MLTSSCCSGIKGSALSTAREMALGAVDKLKKKMIPVPSVDTDILFLRIEELCATVKCFSKAFYTEKPKPSLLMHSYRNRIKMLPREPRRGGKPRG